MKRITFVVPDDLGTLLENERRRRDVPASAIIRDALQQYLAGWQPRRPAFIGLGHSGFHDTARNIDALLEQEWGRDRDR